jgi:hypothetical protein
MEIVVIAIWSKKNESLSIHYFDNPSHQGWDTFLPEALKEIQIDDFPGKYEKEWMESSYDFWTDYISNKYDLIFKVDWIQVELDYSLSC